MQIDGYALREAIKQWELHKSAAEQAFSTSLHKFSNEDKESPQKVVADFAQAEEAIVQLQVAQMSYNLSVTVSVLGEEMPLAAAIKLVGAAGRIEKMWKSATPQKDRYSLDGGLIRDPTQERAESTMTPKEIVAHVTKAGKRSGAFRAAIATANATKAEIEGLNPALFE